ncbi:hypothetical protein R5R35_005795 [Gryllus longicercus]|uniref:Uncharacterized protein n=1 Tax=Gryllus longicercus TaxID=2509291 RepID=A0AAN9W5T0_9ORTH
MSRALELKNIRAVLGHFNVADFQKHVILCFPNHLQEISKRKIKNVTKKVMVNQLTNVIKDESKISLHALHLRLCSVNVSLHSQRRNWHAYEMKNPMDKVVDMKRLHGKLVQGCRLNNLECDIDILKHKDILWITIIQKITKKKHSLVRARPTFCAHILGTSYLFYNGVLEAKMRETFLHAFSFTAVRDLCLFGRDIKSLHKILIRKEGGVASLTVPSYNVEKPRTIFGSRDYTQHENRKKFAAKCFPVDAKVETLTFTNGNSKWGSDIETEDGEGLELRWVIKISSPNVFSALKGFCENNLIEPEHAKAYALRLGKEGKSKIPLPIITSSGHTNE